MAGAWSQSRKGATSIDPAAVAICAWQDPTGGRYGYQTWTRVFAGRDTVWTLTGLSVKRGDAVFHPKNLRDRRPANAESVILAGEAKCRFQSASVSFASHSV
jgi:hypothetical protein